MHEKERSIATAVIIAACVALCALVWPSNEAGENVPVESTVSAMAAEKAEATTLPESAFPALVNHADPMAEKENQYELDAPTN